MAVLLQVDFPFAGPFGNDMSAALGDLAQIEFAASMPQAVALAKPCPPADLLETVTRVLAHA